MISSFRCSRAVSLSNPFVVMVSQSNHRIIESRYERTPATFCFGIDYFTAGVAFI